MRILPECPQLCDGLGRSVLDGFATSIARCCSCAVASPPIVVDIADEASHYYGSGLNDHCLASFVSSEYDSRARFITTPLLYLLLQIYLVATASTVRRLRATPVSNSRNKALGDKKPSTGLSEGVGGSRVFACGYETHYSFFLTTTILPSLCYCA